MFLDRWYAAYVHSRHEKTASKHLESRGIESFLPLYREVKRWGNRVTTTVELPLFPGYVFVRFKAQERVRILEIPGVIHLVGSSGRPAPLPDIDIGVLREGLALVRAEPCPFLSIGQRVRLRTGPLAGLEGMLVQKKNGYRFVLSMDLIMQSVAVEVDAADIEPLTPSFLSTSAPLHDIHSRASKVATD
jgi:transcription antitermination factor NusG